MAAEFESSLNELYFALHGVVVPPIRVGSGRYEADNRRALTEARPCLLHPSAYPATVGWVHPTDARPGLNEGIFLDRVELGALGVFACRANVQSEAVASMVLVEKRLRRRPQVRLAAEMKYGVELLFKHLRSLSGL